MKKTVVIAGPMFTRSGYGNHAYSLALSLIKSDLYDVKLYPLPWGTTPNINLNPNDPEHALMLSKVLREAPFKPDIWIQISIPNEFQPNGHFNIGITAGIETTLTKPEWIEGLNRMDLIIATSEFTKNVFKAQKFEKRNKQTNAVESILTFTKPIEVLFEGINYELYKNNSVCDSIKEKLNDLPDFCFLAVGHWLQGGLGHDRKDIGMLVKTFLDTFKRRGKRKQPALVLKTSLAGFSVLEQEIIKDRLDQICELVKSEGWVGKLPAIYLINGDLTEEEMKSLYMHPKIKAMVSFTHGEGFGRPLLEFSATGKPILAPNWSGQLDFLDPKHCFLMPGELVNVDASSVNEWIVTGSQWFRVNYEYATKLMQYCHDEYDKILTITSPHRKITLNNFTEEKMSAKFLEIIEKYINIKNEPKQLTIKLPKLTKVTE